MDTGLRVLILEDSDERAEATLRPLREGDRAVEFRRVDSADSTEEALDTSDWDVFLIRCGAQCFSGLQALKLVQDRGLELPCIVVGGALTPDRIALAFNSGARDYIPDDRPEGLLVAVTRERRATEERRRGELARKTFADLAQDLAGAAALEEVGEILASGSRRLFRHDAFILAVLNESTGLWESVHAEDTAPGASEPQAVPMEPPRGESPLNPAQRGESSLINRMEEPRGTPFRKFGFTDRLSRSLMYVPVWKGDAVIGTLTAQSYTPGRYTDEDLSLLQAFANQCSGALARLRAQKALREREDQYLQAQKMEAVGQLAGGIAHDFNNLLTAVLGHGQLLRDQLRERPAELKRLDLILNSMKRASVLTRQLLAFSRKQVMEPRVFNLNALLRETEDVLSPLMGEEIVLKKSFAPDLGNVSGDPAQIQQVLINLAANAREAMPKGGTLEVRTTNTKRTDVPASEPGLAPGDYVLLTIRDTGCGMDAATRARLFEPFFTTKPNGTGLGLATAFGIVKQSGGAIEVESEIGRGTTFSILLPRVARETDTALRRPRRDHAPPRGTETVLLVEDTEVIRRLSTEVLVAGGYKVLAASRGEEAIELARRHDGSISLLITDVVMPGMRGPELAAALAATRPELKVLFMSGYAEDCVDGWKDGGGDASFLPKPFTPDDLSRTVRDALDGLSSRT